MYSKYDPFVFNAVIPFYAETGLEPFLSFKRKNIFRYVLLHHITFLFRNVNHIDIEIIDYDILMVEGWSYTRIVPRSRFLIRKEKDPKNEGG
jgi:hypothetical protein